MKTRYFVITLVTTLLLGCGGGGSSETAEAETPLPVTQPDPSPVSPTIYTGIFLDSAVENLNFSTATESGSTNEQGEFTYQLDEQVTFSIGGIEFPQVDADTTITPLTIFETQDINATAVVNMLRLLQSLDEDGDATNGITIPSAAHNLASGLSIDFDDVDFESKVETLIEMSGAVNQQLITAVDAVYHFQQTLNNDNMSSCDKTHSTIGYSGFFSTFSHNVAGKATIIDDCTIEISQFDYDGGGPEVYIYAAIDHQYTSSDAFAVSQKITGQAYENATFILKLPDNKSLDDLTGLSVWCVDFAVDFGSMEFTP